MGMLADIAQAHRAGHRARPGPHVRPEAGAPSRSPPFPTQPNTAHAGIRLTRIGHAQRRSVYQWRLPHRHTPHRARRWRRRRSGWRNGTRTPWTALSSAASPPAPASCPRPAPCPRPAVLNPGSVIALMVPAGRTNGSLGAGLQASPDRVCETFDKVVLLALHLITTPPFPSFHRQDPPPPSLSVPCPLTLFHVLWGSWLHWGRS
jgi:hypothetical protein